jgi:hypothetical protein
MRRRSVLNFWCRFVRVMRLTEMSSRTAAWGQPPVSTATMRSLLGRQTCTHHAEMTYGCSYAGKALFLVRNSQSSRVKISFVTAAIENRVRRCLQRASMSAVFPEPTGLGWSVSCAYILPCQPCNCQTSAEQYRDVCMSHGVHRTLQFQW